MTEWFRKLFGPYGPETRKVQLTFFLGSWVFLAAIGLFIPQTVLTDHPSLRAFTDFMASFIPQIDRVTALNLRPEVNRLHYSILWAVSPIFPGLMLPAIFLHSVADKKPKTYGDAILGLVVCAWLIGFSMFLWDGFGFIDDPHNRIARVMFYHPLSRAITAPMIVSGFWMFSTLFIFVVWSLLTGRYHSAKRSETRG